MKPIEEVANFIGPKTRIINTGHRRDMDLGVMIPRDELGPIASHEMWAELYDRLAELEVEGVTNVVLDLARLNFMDSTGLGVTEHKRVQRVGGTLTIFSPSSPVRRLFEITGLTQCLDIVPAKGEP